MSEKFKLKWSDFKHSVSQSFRSLRGEEDFLDVTLVSDDEKQVQAHKLVLSACSDFFKSILRRNPHPNPLIYLTGVSSSDLGLILDYVYHGEVQIFQEQLDNFLAVAQKLKINGLKTNGTDEVNEINTTEDTKVQGYENYEDMEPVYYEREIVNYEHEGNRNIKTIAVDESFDENQIQTKISELIEEIDGKKRCKVCGYSSSQIRRHVEVHIEGLSYSCQLCGKIFKSKNSLNFHKYNKKCFV